MNINNLSSGYSGYNILLHTNEDDITQSKSDTATADAKDKASESKNEKTTKTDRRNTNRNGAEIDDLKSNHPLTRQG